jgi:hypothetical protein
MSSSNAIMAQAATGGAVEQASIWSEVQPWEIALLAAGVVLTLVIVGFFVWLAVRAGREERTTIG